MGFFTPKIPLYSYFNRLIGQAATGYNRLDDADVHPVHDLSRIAAVTNGRYRHAEFSIAHAVAGPLYTTHTVQIIDATATGEALQLNEDMWLMDVGYLANHVTAPTSTYMWAQVGRDIAGGANCLRPILAATTFQSADLAATMWHDDQPRLSLPLNLTGRDKSGRDLSIYVRDLSTAAGMTYWHYMVWCGPIGLLPPHVA